MSEIEKVRDKYMDLSKSLDEPTRNVFITFVSEVYDRTDNYKTLKEYCNVALRALKELAKPIFEITIDDILTYIEHFAGSRQNKIIGRLAEIYLIAERDTPNLKVSSHEIKQHTVASGQIEPVNPGVPINLIAVARLREKLIEYGMIRNLLTFELIYSCGLKEDELALCKQDSLDDNCTCFVINGNAISLPEYLRPLVAKNAESIFNRNGRKDAKNFKYHINRAGDLINEKLTILDVLATWKRYSITCSICNKSYPSEASYWGIVNCTSDSGDVVSRPLICCKCIESEAYKK